MSMGGYIRLLVGIALFATGWSVNGWRKDADLADVKRQHAEVLAGIARKTTDAVTAVRKLEQAANSAISTADKSATERIAKNDQENRSLRACVAAGTCGVRIITRSTACAAGGDVPQDAGAGGVGDGAVALDDAAANRVLDLRESVQSDAAKLAYLREYASACYRAGVEGAGVVGGADSNPP